MMRRIAVVGDRLTGGGHILSGDLKPSFTFHGRQVALVGGEAYCEVCNSIGGISRNGGRRRITFLGMRDVALDRDIVLCNCPNPPEIIAVNAGDSMVDDGVETHFAKATSATDTVANCSGPTEVSAEKTYDEQIIVDSGRCSSVGYPYAIEWISGKTLCGRIEWDCRLPRIATERVDDYAIHWGEEALGHDGWK